MRQTGSQLMQTLWQEKIEGSSQPDAMDELLQICHNDVRVQAVISHFQVSDEQLREFYSILCLFGAGQSFGGHYVPASSLVYDYTLFFIVDNWPKNDATARDEMSYIAFRLIEYFRKGETGRVR